MAWSLAIQVPDAVWRPMKSLDTRSQGHHRRSNSARHGPSHPINPTHPQSSASPMKRLVSPTFAFLTSLAFAYAAPPPEGWQTATPRDEISPAFSFEPKGGPN